jgi:signal transduction histidine kinase
MGIFRDITKEREEERQKAEFISTASHEMRTPVAAIEGYLALAQNSKVATIDERAKIYLEKAHTATQHLGQLFPAFNTNQTGLPVI